MLVAISGGAGFFGLHLSRRLVTDGHAVRTLDVAPLDDRELEGRVEELRGDVRSTRDARRLVAGADVLVHAAAALPIQQSRAAIRSVNVDGMAVTFAAAGSKYVGKRLRDLRFPRGAIVGAIAKPTGEVIVPRGDKTIEANDRVIRLVARALGVAPSGVELAAGARARTKRLRIVGLGDEELRRRLARIGSD